MNEVHLDKEECTAAVYLDSKVTKALLVMSSKLEENLSLASYITIKAYKKNIKCAILDQQGSGEATLWHSSNFPLKTYRASDGHVLNIGPLSITIRSLP